MLISVRIFVVLLFLLTSLSPNCLKAESIKPNIVFLMADDLGYDDIGAFGGDITTPNIDALAAAGMRLTDFHTAGAVCSPTRASILTGNFPLRFGITRALTELEVRGIPSEYTFLPSVLAKHGYTTAHFGKWHLGRTLEKFRPHMKGFEEVWEWAAGENGYLDFIISHNGAPDESISDGTYFPEFITDKAVEFINQHANDTKPFFLNLWHFAPHAPLHVPPGFDNSSYGYDLSTSRGKIKSMISALDYQIGRVIQAIDNAGLSNNTLFIVTSDNGAFSGGVSPFSVLRGVKQEMFEGGIKVPFIARWPGVIPANTSNHSLVVSFDLFCTLSKVAGAKCKDAAIPSINFLDALKSNALLKRKDPLYWEIESARSPEESSTGTRPNFAVRVKDLKYVSQTGQEYLFNMANDPMEQNNLISSLPKTAAKLRKLHASWRLGTSLYKNKIKLSKTKVQQLGNELRFKKKLGVAKLYNPYVERVGAGDISIAFSLRPKKISGQRVVLNNSGYLLTMDNGQLSFSITNQFGTKFSISGPKLHAKKRYRIVVSSFGWKSGTLTMRLFVNGKLYGERTEKRSIVATSAGPLVFGNYYEEPLSAASFIGSIYNLKVYTVSFTDEEVKADYKKYH